ncbi:MAG: hypothetical protein H6912_06665 [Kordiimonadaceae bacterium]|nr:hypothetical protein [Kordiimonadaceae bacterium]
MASFGKADHTGRSSGKHNGRLSKRMGPPKDKKWTWVTAELLESNAWRSRSRKCALLIDFLLCDHMANAGQENGRLMATYDQLVVWGIRRPDIRATIDEAEMLGLIRQTFQGGRYGKAKEPSQYRLTFFPTISENGTFAPATNEWKSVTEKMIDHYTKMRRESKKSKKQYNGSYDETFIVPTEEPKKVKLKVIK